MLRASANRAERAEEGAEALSSASDDEVGGSEARCASSIKSAEEPRRLIDQRHNVASEEFHPRGRNWPKGGRRK
jgi:hypothetical protein